MACQNNFVITTEILQWRQKLLHNIFLLWCLNFIFSVYTWKFTSELSKSCATARKTLKQRKQRKHYQPSRLYYIVAWNIYNLHIHNPEHKPFWIQGRHLIMNYKYTNTTHIQGEVHKVLQSDSTQTIDHIQKCIIYINIIII